jgi:integrase
MSVTLNVVEAGSRVHQRIPSVKHHDDLLKVPRLPGQRDGLALGSVLDLFPALSNWPDSGSGRQAEYAHGGRQILEWLHRHPGSGWQGRWISSGADEGTSWLDSLIIEDSSRSPSTQHRGLRAGLAGLLLCRIVRPSYQFLTSIKFGSLPTFVRQEFRPDVFDRIEARTLELFGGQRERAHDTVKTISKIVLHTGRDPDQLVGTDLLTYWAWRRHRAKGARAGIPALTMAWAALYGIADLGEHRTLKDALRYGQPSIDELVDAYQIRCRPVRDMFVRYFSERRTGLDYNSLTCLISILVGGFWADIEQHHPGIASLHLAEEVATAWKHRRRTKTTKNGVAQPAKDFHHVMTLVRGFYRDLQDWAHEDPSWAQWNVPNPIHKSDVAGQSKAKQRATAAMHQRTRERVAHLPELIEAAERHKDDQAKLRARAEATTIGDTFRHSGNHYRKQTSRQGLRLLVEDMETGDLIDVGKAEADAFWAWAIIETLRHTGIRIEELLEVTHLALVSYRLPDTGETVPMLQIVPSKSNEERLLLVSPELASVLATIISRLRAENNGSVPLTARYDPHERIIGPPLPHLFQHRYKITSEVFSSNTVQVLLTKTLARTGLTDAAGQPLRYTPHDFRRVFVTEAVAGGLPVHIAAKILGHANINTTQAYLAVFDENLIRSYRAFLDNRRSQRPAAEYREPTDDEWREFQQHFQLRKLEIGECGRPYGTPCKHEHVCLRCPSLRLDPAARPRLAAIIANLQERIMEAKTNGWLGEVQGLELSLNAAINKIVSLDRRLQQPQPGLVNLGIPLIRP